MGDISNETSMEDILSSIKRIIAEEGEGSAQALRGRKSLRMTPPRDMEDRVYDGRGQDGRSHFDDDDDEVLELDRRVAAPPPPVRETPRVERPRAAAPPPPEPVAPPAPPEIDASIVSERVAEASRGSLDQLSRMLVKPETAETPASDSLQVLVREMLRPMLRDWLDANLPGMVEAMVAREIARITGRE